MSGLWYTMSRKSGELARQQGVPAFIILGDKSLKDMAAIKSITREAFAGVYGVGDHKLHAYGDVFTEVIKQYLKNKTR